MYVCGMTPKDKPHIGHARVFVMADTLRRYIEHRGQAVRHVQNFTDIDDKIIERARQQSRDPIELSKENSDHYFTVMDLLNVSHAHVFPRVTDHIEEIKSCISDLIERNYAYQTSEGVYFEVGQWDRYGSLSGRTSDDVMPGARVEIDPEKRNPRDFALWKRHKKGEVFWDSTWGPGRPGWHIECSSMIHAHLGTSIDIHAGGSDLIFPHHENEQAQAEAGFGTSPFVHHWFHVGVLRIGGEKMGHSMGNFITLENLFNEFSPSAIRLYLLSTHYRAPVDFTEGSLPQASAGFDRLQGALRAKHSDSNPNPTKDTELRDICKITKKNFYEAMDADLNTAAAIGCLFDLARSINRLASSCSETSVTQSKTDLLGLTSILGIKIDDHTSPSGEIKPYIDLLLELRSTLRDEKNWALADQIRDSLLDLRVIIEDDSEGTTWRMG